MSKIDKKILIVEDDKSFLWILRQSLEGEGFSVVFAEDGEEGLKMAQEEKPDLILLDIMLPKMDGIEVAKHIKEIGFETQVIFLTNMSDLEHMSQAMEAVKSDYIIKSDVPIGKIVIEVKKKLGIP